MSKYHDNRYDEMKSLLSKSKILTEQISIKRTNIGKSIEDEIATDQEFETADAVDNRAEEDTTTKKEKSQKYRISGGILNMHGEDKSDIEITTDDKIAFQDTMDEFVTDVSDFADFNELNVYPNNVEWSGKLIEEDIDFLFRIGESSGLYINGDMIKVDEDFLDLINKLQAFYQKFKSKWGKVLASRKKTTSVNDEEL